MSTLRFKAVEEALKRVPVDVVTPGKMPSEYFGKYVFNRTQMSKYLSKETMEIVLEAIDSGTTLNRGIADHVAAGMKMWAVEMGATHYTHWFQPLTEGTAEKSRRCRSSSNCV
jgi:glutamine synthetase